MSLIKPFKAVRPAPELVGRVVSPPYDVLNASEVRNLCYNNPYSFLHVIRAEVDLPDVTDAHAPEVYQKGKDNLQAMLQAETLIKDRVPCFYIYRLEMDQHVQTGLAAAVSVQEYRDNIIRKHELTRADKEQDRTEHIRSLEANTGPVLITYRNKPVITRFIDEFCRNNSPEYHFPFRDGTIHSLWVVSEDNDVQFLQDNFETVPVLYIADGHHRSAAAAKVEEIYRNNLNLDAGFFLSVIFPDIDLKIMGYNRVIKDLNGLSGQELLEKIRGKFTISEGGKEPAQSGFIGMFLEGQWYQLHIPPGMKNNTNAEENLDVAILQNGILNPIFGITDPRTDKRIDFVGGIRGTQELERRCREDMQIAFCLFPVSVSELMEISDQGRIMPPKSTWFEPKLGSGLVIRSLNKEDNS